MSVLKYTGKVLSMRPFIIEIKILKRQYVHTVKTFIHYFIIF